MQSSRGALYLALVGLVGQWACDEQPLVPPGTRTPDAEVRVDDDTVDEAAPEVYVPAPPTFACLPGSGPATSVAPLQPLTRVQYTNTLHDLLRWATDEATASALMAVAAVPLAQIPKDDTRLEGDGGDVSQAHVEGHYKTAVALAAALTRDENIVTKLVDDCAAHVNDACLTPFIERFGGRVLRRPLAADEVAFFRDEVFAPAGDGGLRALLTALLMSPELVFHVEGAGELLPGTDDVVALTGYELASRLSYLFWQSAPDDALYAAAADGSLLTEAGYRAAVTRVFEDPRTRTTIDGFFAQWLDLERLPEPANEVGTEPFDTFAAGMRPGPELRRDMAQDVLAAARHEVWEAGGDLDDFFLNDHSYATTADLAAIYEVPVWDGGDAPQFPADTRAGLLTRAALLVSGTWHTMPIHKGVRIRQRLLCDEVGHPPSGATNATVPLPAPFTQRDYAEALTMRDATSCNGCHAWMNPLGFVTEGYDGLGRRRTAELAFDEATGEHTWLDIDTVVVPQADRADPREAADPMEATDLMLESGKPHACVARYYFRFAFGRLEDLIGDGCLLERLRAGLWGGAPLHDVLRDLALSPEFKVRRVGVWGEP